MLFKTPVSEWCNCEKGDRVLKLEYVLPDEIEKRSFEIIESELGDRIIPDEIKPIVMRVIHTSADFDYYDNLCFSENAVKIAIDAIRKGVVFVTDTNMAKSGINPKTLQYLMGHSDISVTMNVYTHISFDDAEEELKRMEEFRKAQAEIEKKNDAKAVSQKMFKVV